MQSESGTWHAMEHMAGDEARGNMATLAATLI